MLIPFNQTCSFCTSSTRHVRCFISMLVAISAACHSSFDFFEVFAPSALCSHPNDSQVACEDLSLARFHMLRNKDCGVSRQCTYCRFHFFSASHSKPYNTWSPTYLYNNPRVAFRRAPPAPRLHERLQARSGKGNRAG